MVDLRSLEAFYWVAKLGGFGRAAEKLHTTQPAISSRIAQLEARFNVRLFDREARRRPTLTPRGLELLAHAERMLELSGEIAAAMAEPAELRGTVRLGTSETLVHTWLSTLVRRVHALHPRVTIDVTVDLSVGLRAALLAGEIDVAFLLGPLGVPGMTDVKLCDYELAWAANPGLGMGQARVGLAELARFPVITYPRATPVHQQVAALFNRPGLPTPRIFSSTALSSVIRMAVDGIGVCVLPPAAIARELASGELRLLDVEPALAPLTFTASFFQRPGASAATTIARMAAQVAREHRS